jgi:hypothetical protein
LLKDPVFKLEAEVLLYQGVTPQDFVAFMKDARKENNRTEVIRTEKTKWETEKIREEKKPEVLKMEIEKIREEKKPEVLKLEREKIIAEKEKIEAETKCSMLRAPVPSVRARPATVDEVASGVKVNATSLPGRRVIGDQVYCGTEDDLRDGDVIHGPGAPVFVTSSKSKHQPCVSFIADKVAHYRELFRQSRDKKKMWILAKSTVASDEAIKSIPDIVYMGRYPSRSFPRKIPAISDDIQSDIVCYVGLFDSKGTGERDMARALFVRLKK